MAPDYDAWRFWFSLLQWLLTLGVGFFAWWINRDKARRLDVDGRIGGLEERVTQVERDQYHAPTHHDIGNVYERLNETNTSLAELTGQLGTLATSLGRIETYLLNNGHRGSGG